MEGCFTLQWGRGLFFRWGSFLFKSRGGVLKWGTSVLMGGGGSKNIVGWRERPSSLSETLLRR